MAEIVNKRGQPVARLMEALYQLSLSDHQIGRICQVHCASVKGWRQGLDYPANPAGMPYNPMTGKVFTAKEMSLAIQDKINEWEGVSS